MAAFVFHGLGHKQISPLSGDFDQLFGNENIKLRHGVSDHSVVEAAHDSDRGKIYINTGAKNMFGKPLGKADRDAAYQHEHVHHQINKLAKKSNQPGIAKHIISAYFIKHLDPFHVDKIKDYVDHVRSSASEGKSSLPEHEVNLEVIPYLASIATPGSSHRAAFQGIHKLSHDDMKPYDESWKKVVGLAKDFGVNSQPADVKKSLLESAESLLKSRSDDIAVANIKAKYSKPKELTTEQEVRYIKGENTPTKEPTFEEQIAAIKAKYAARQKPMQKSNYGPKGAGLYDPTKSIKRKKNRTGEELPDVGQNKAVHEYTSAPMGTANAQAEAEAKKAKKLNAKQPVKVFTPEERAALEAEKMKKSVSYAVRIGMQPSSEAWEKEVARALGLPVTQADAETLAKQAEDKWNNVFNDFYKGAATRVEKSSPQNYGSRGPVDQNDRSSLTEEELRISQIEVPSELFE